MKLQLTILNRSDFSVKAKADCYSWEINRDYLTNEKSQFALLSPIAHNVGDFLIANAELGKYRKTGTNLGSIKPIYFGIIESSEQGKDNILNARDFYNIVNFDFAATYGSGQNVQQHLQKLLLIYLTTDTSKDAQNVQISLTGAPINWIYKPSDPPTSTNLNWYFVNVFKKYQVTWEATDIYYDENGQINISTTIGPKQNTLNLKNNIYDFTNWNVYYTPANTDVPNKLEIIDKATSDMENPNVLSTWYLQKDGNLSQIFNPDTVFVPTQNKVAIYDTEEESPPTFQEVARSEMSGKLYSHEITFDVNLNSRLIYVPDLEIGSKANIIYGSDLYPSVLTGYIIKSGSEWVTLKFGNIRSTRQSVIDGLD
jgi:hypothetical protein